MWQARHVQSQLKALFPQTRIEILAMSTRGDKIVDRPLAAIGGKGLFIKELEVAMQSGKADLAVHSLKDVPMHVPAGFVLASIPVRENPLDAFVSNRYSHPDEMPAGAVIGTASLRRAANLRALYPHIKVSNLRGNLDTRLKKLDSGQYDAVVLAAAGLHRLGMDDRIRLELPTEISLPAPGQGALGIETRAGEPQLDKLLSALHDPVTAQCVSAERAFSRALGGSCQIPLGAYATLDGDELHLRGFISDEEGSKRYKVDEKTNIEHISDTGIAERFGETLAAKLLQQGADSLLNTLTDQ